MNPHPTATLHPVRQAFNVYDVPADGTFVAVHGTVFGPACQCLDRPVHHHTMCQGVEVVLFVDLLGSSTVPSLVLVMPK